MYSVAMAAEEIASVASPSGDDSLYCAYPGNLQRIGCVRHFLKYSAELQSLVLACADAATSIGPEARAVAINAIGPNEATLLHAAIVLDHGVRATELLAAGATPSYAFSSGRTPPLDVAIDNGSVASIKAFIDWCLPAGADHSAVDPSAQPATADRGSQVFGHFIWGHRIEPSPRSVIGLQALADHPHLLLAVPPLQQGAEATSYVAGATGKFSLLEETLEDQSAQSPVRVRRLMAWRAAEAFGQLRVLKMLRSRYVGDNSHIVVGDIAARHGRVDILEWLWQDDKFAPGPGCPYGPYDGRYWTKAEVAASWMDSAAWGGNIASINWLLDHGVPLRESACNRASTYGHVEALELLRRHGCPWSSATTAAAAKGNQLDALKWLRANGCPWGTEVVLVACGHRLSMLEWCLDNGAPVQADICTAIAACYVCYFDLRVVRNAVSAIAAIRALGYACNGDTVTALLTCSTNSHYGDSESDSKARREVISSGLKLCLLDGVTPTSELLMMALKAGEYLAAEVMLERDPSLMAPTPALRYFVDAINRSSALPVYSVSPMIRWLVRAGAELSPDFYVIAAKPAAFWSANAQAHIHFLQALRACGCPWDESVTAAVVELASAERPDASSASAAELFANHGGTHTGYHLSQLGWLRQNGCPWDRSSCRIAAASGNVEVKQWLIDHRCRCEGELHPTAAPAAAQNACQV